VAYDGACCSNVSIRMARISFGALPCRKIKPDVSSRFDVAALLPCCLVDFHISARVRNAALYKAE